MCTLSSTVYFKTWNVFQKFTVLWQGREKRERKKYNTISFCYSSPETPPLQVTCISIISTPFLLANWWHIRKFGILAKKEAKCYYLLNLQKRSKQKQFEDISSFSFKISKLNRNMNNRVEEEEAYLCNVAQEALLANAETDLHQVLCQVSIWAI